MKTISAIIFLCFFSMTCTFSSTLDSLKMKREFLYEKYSTLSNSNKEFKKIDYEKQLSVLKDLIVVDTRIIKEFSAFDKKEIELNATVIALNDENDQLSKELNSIMNRQFVYNLTIGILMVLCVIALIGLYFYYTKFKQVKAEIDVIDKNNPENDEKTKLLHDYVVLKHEKNELEKKILELKQSLTKNS